MQSFLQSHPSPPGFANFFKILSFSLLPPLDTYWQVVYCVLLNWHVSQSVCLFTEVDKLVLFWQWETLFLCLSALVQSLVYFVIASLSVIWRREVVTLQPLSVFSLFSVFFSYLCPQLAFCEVNCFWCCQIGITAHTFISLFVYNIFSPYDLFIFFVRTKLLILEAKLASPVLIKKACYRLSIHVYVSPINYIKQLCLVFAFSISYNSLTWQEWHLLLIVLNWKPKDYWLKSLHTN